MTRRPIDPKIDAGGGADEAGPGVTPEAFREVMSRWAAGVAVVAVRDGGDLHATTVSSFASVSAQPPLVVISLGAGAQVLPFLNQGARFTVSLLEESQTRIASVFADPFPVGPSPFPETGHPVVEGALAAMICQVHRVVPVESSRLILGLVLEVEMGPEGRPLVYWRRDYRTLSSED